MLPRDDRGKLPPEEKKELGQAANKVRNEIEELVNARMAEVKAAAKEAQFKAEKIDVTEPGKAVTAGVKHPVTLTIEEISKVFMNMGFSIVVHHGEEHDSLIQLNDEEGIWHLGAEGLMGEKPKFRLTEAVAQKGNITYLVGFELEDELYNERSFRSMLSYFDTYETKLELIVSDMEVARQHYRERAAVYEQAKEDEYKQARATLETELATVETELDKLKVQ